jgi:hypothetical protein
MKTKIIIASIFLVVLLGLNVKPVQASLTAGSSAVLKNTSAIKEDVRVNKLKSFLEFYQSPLADYAREFINAADRYQIDWRLVPAITGVESTFGKRIPANSYNAYGWANGVYYFQSWEQSIDHVTRVLKEKYYDRGLDTPVKIAPVYAPPSNTWAGKVTYFINLLDCFGDEDCLENLELTI